MILNIRKVQRGIDYKHFSINNFLLLYYFFNCGNTAIISKVIKNEVKDILIKYIKEELKIS